MKNTQLSGMEVIGTVEVLALNAMSVSDAFEVINRVEEGLSGVFDDNGGEPDGPSWYIPVDEIGWQAANAITANGLGYIIDADKIKWYDGNDDDREWMKAHYPHRWCGYSSRDVAYGINFVETGAA